MRTKMILFALALISVAAAQDPAIVYKYSDAYERIWHDAGSEADRDGAVWRVRNYQSEFCSLGDIATDGWGRPTAKAVLVSQRKAGALSHPIRFSRVWRDSGSGAYSDVAIYMMNAPSGYTCLGGVAMGSHYTKPDSSKYCCVKNQYVVQADTVHTWNDKGSGAYSDLSLWTVIRAGGDAFGIDAGTFIGVNGYSRPSSSYLLRADGNNVRDVWSLPTIKDDKPLNLYEVGELKMIWNEAGSGADADFSIWRAESRSGYYPIGDIFVASHSKPKIGFLLKPKNVNDDSVRAPKSYSKIWGANRGVQLWSVICPWRYVSLGSVATSGSYPQIGDVYCVKSSYCTEYGSYGLRGISSWRYVSNVGRDNVIVPIYEARTLSRSLQSVRGFGAVSIYRGSDRSRYPRYPPYFLDKQYHSYWAEEPIEKIYIYNVQYDLNSERQQTAPVKMSPTVVENFSDQPQTLTRTITYSIAESTLFTYSQAIQLGIAVEIEAKVPIIGAGAKTTVSASTTSTFETGSTTTKTHTDSINAWVQLPGRSKMTAVIVGTEYRADIPYSATIRKVYYDGSQAYATISGVYKGVAVSEIEVTYGAIEYFD